MSSFRAKLKRLAAKGVEAELALKLNYEQLFDPMILAPHTEINNEIFEAIDRFADHQIGYGSLNITIFIDHIGPAVREKFLEAYQEHYHDVLRKAVHEVHVWYFKVFLFVAISVVGLIFWAYGHVGDRTSSFIQNIWAFSSWQVGGTLVEGTSTWDFYRQVKYILAADIEFSELKPKTSKTGKKTPVS